MPCANKPTSCVRWAPGHLLSTLWVDAYPKAENREEWSCSTPWGAPLLGEPKGTGQGLCSCVLGSQRHLTRHVTAGACKRGVMIVPVFIITNNNVKLCVRAIRTFVSIMYFICNIEIYLVIINVNYTYSL